MPTSSTNDAKRTSARSRRNVATESAEAAGKDPAPTAAVESKGSGPPTTLEESLSPSCEDAPARDTEAAAAAQARGTEALVASPTQGTETLSASSAPTAADILTLIRTTFPTLAEGPLAGPPPPARDTAHRTAADASSVARERAAIGRSSQGDLGRDLGRGLHSRQDGDIDRGIGLGNVAGSGLGSGPRSGQALHRDRGTGGAALGNERTSATAPEFRLTKGHLEDAYEAIGTLMAFQYQQWEGDGTLADQNELVETLHRFMAEAGMRVPVATLPHDVSTQKEFVAALNNLLDQAFAAKQSFGGKPPRKVMSVVDLDIVVTSLATALRRQHQTRSHSDAFPASDAWPASRARVAPEPRFSMAAATATPAVDDDNDEAHRMLLALQDLGQGRPRGQATAAVHLMGPNRTLEHAAYMSSDKLIANAVHAATLGKPDPSDASRRLHERLAGVGPKSFWHEFLASRWSVTLIRQLDHSSAGNESHHTFSNALRLFSDLVGSVFGTVEPLSSFAAEVGTHLGTLFLDEQAKVSLPELVDFTARTLMTGLQAALREGAETAPPMVADGEDARTEWFAPFATFDSKLRNGNDGGVLERRTDLSASEYANLYILSRAPRDPPARSGAASRTSRAKAASAPRASRDRAPVPVPAGAPCVAFLLGRCPITPCRHGRRHVPIGDLSPADLAVIRPRVEHTLAGSRPQSVPAALAQALGLQPPPPAAPRRS